MKTMTKPAGVWQGTVCSVFLVVFGSKLSLLKGLEEIITETGSHYNILTHLLLFIQTIILLGFSGNRAGSYSNQELTPMTVILDTCLRRG